MRILRAITASLALVGGLASTAFGGVGGTVTGTVTSLGGVTQVTYSIESPKVMDTYVGYQISLGNTGGTATATNTSLTVTATARDPAEVVRLLLNANVVLPAGCSKTTDNSFTCKVGQLKAGQPFPTFQAFFRAPTRVVNGSFDDEDPSDDNDVSDNDHVKITMTWFYAERGNDQDPNSNSSGSASDATVLLGTANPTSVKSVVPKSGASLYTGVEGIPNGVVKSTMLANVPPLTVPFTTADLLVTSVTDDANTGDPTCIAQGNFRECPTYDVKIPGTFAFLTTTYRIDGSSQKKGAAKILSDVIITYSDPLAVPPVPETILGQCAGLNTPRSDGIPCINKQRCFKNNAKPSTLAEDCEWETINTKNGLTRFR